MPYAGVPDELTEKMDDCVSKVMAKGHDKDSAIAMCHASVVEGQSAALDFALDPELFVGRRNSAKDAERLQQIHDFAVENGAQCTMQGMMKMSSDYLIDEFTVAIKPGEPYRLFPFGVIVKNGKRREITPEYAARFKLPHFHPPIKLGSHDEKTPAGGQIAGLEVREDGLYAIPEVTEKGAKALEEGDYRYHSPEVIWDDGGLEDPKTGEIIAGPMIVGDALLHTPHLGNAAALYTIEKSNISNRGGENVSDETVQVDKSLWEKFRALFTAKDPEPVTEPTPPAPAPAREDYEAMQAKNAALAAEVERLSAEKTKADLFAVIGNDFNVTEYGAAFPSMKGEAVPVLAGMTPEQRKWVVEKFRALSAQINESALVASVGRPASAASGPDEAIKAYMSANKVDYVTAFEAVRASTPEIFKK